MKASTVNALSTVAISVGSFLLGSSFGISLVSRNCEECYKNELYDCFMKRLNDGIATIVPKESISPEALKDIRNSFLVENHDEIFNLNDEESLVEYQRQVNRYSIGDTNGDEDDESYANTIKEITVGDEAIEIEQIDYNSKEAGEPYIVSKDSYEYEYEDFYKEDLVYFEEDGILVDDRDEIIDNPDRFIGAEALENFGEGSDDEDVVYVRNLRQSIDYRIVREHTSYQENVLGLTEEGDRAAYKAALEFANTKQQSANIKKE